jgi:hypothetical protein
MSVRARATFASIAVLLATCALGVPRAPAQTAAAAQGVTVDWRAPAECPDPSFVRDEIARLLAGSSAASVRVDARADVTRAGSAWRVRLATGGGERTLEASSCRALAEATALILALAVDPARVAVNRAVASSAGPVVDPTAAPVDAGAPDASPPDASPPDAVAPLVAITTDAGMDAADAVDASSVAPVVVTPKPAPAPRETPSFSGPTSFAIGVGAIDDVGTLPFVGVGASIFAAWTPAPVRLELAGANFAANHTAPLANGSGGTFVLAAGALRGCYDLVVTELALLPCAGLELEALRGEGTGVLTSSPATSVWLVGTLGALVQWRLSPLFALDARLDAGFPLQRPEFRIDDVTLHKPAAVSGRVVLGGEIRF